MTTCLDKKIVKKRSAIQDTQCNLPDYTPPSEEIKDILDKCNRIAIVGISPKEQRISNKIARYLMGQGYEIIPINPGQRNILGKPCYKTIKDIPFPIDMVNLFVNSAKIPPFVDQAIELGVYAIWMQSGITHNKSAEMAKKRGIQVVMDRCIMMEHQKTGCKCASRGAPP